jgi:hypothetical protein
MHRTGASVTVVSGVVLLALWTSSPQGAMAAPNPTLACTGEWEIQPSPSPGGVARDSNLLAVSALSSDDVWAAGWYMNDGFRPLALVEHWDGTAWEMVPTPIVGTKDNYLYGIAALSSDDVWAVGSVVHRAAVVTLAMHWDGVQWTVTPTPNRGTVHSALVAVSGTAGDDVWAVGSTFIGDRYHSLVQHWDGSTWSITPSASSPRGTYLTAVRATPSATWSVAYTGSSPRTVVERKAGERWPMVPSENVPGANNFLYGVASAGSEDAWAVGHWDTSEDPRATTLIQRWDGSAWRIVPSPDPEPNGNDLRGVAALSPTEAWAVGFSLDPSHAPKTLVERWDGTSWTVFPSPNQQDLSSLLAISATPNDTDLWAVGHWYDAGVAQTLVEHYCS